MWEREKEVRDVLRSWRSEKKRKQEYRCKNRGYKELCEKQKKKRKIKGGKGQQGREMKFLKIMSREKKRR